MINLCQKYFQDVSLSFSEFANNFTKSISTKANKDIINNSVRTIDNWFDLNRFNKYLYDLESLLQ